MPCIIVGAEYSSPSCLRSFPFDNIKIDCSFVSELATREDSMAVMLDRARLWASA
ncbi:hypothetical protein [Bradyrhizobium sp. 199]|uniref:hypothetical protein n=1 Tax=Bradyrhizobium sp. 199 TaxID=2782664 RepID=UPI001FF81334|nr:hypothetical protein [Bradyrhizobium sp. 199]MCK1359131.1 hypothetical protein [Bradyrhizobium sp. 199]